MTSYIYDMVDTWNAGATTFTAVKMNVTDTASASGSLLMDLQVGGSSKFKIDKNGTVTAQGSFIYQDVNGTTLNNFGLTLATGAIYFRNGAGTSADLVFGRRAAANLRLGAADSAAPVAQTLSVQSVVAGTSNTAGANLTITGSQGTGTGAGGSIVFQVAPAGSSGTAQNALATAFQVNGNGGITGQDGATTNTLALRNGANPQSFRVYNTTDGAGNSEWAEYSWSGSVAYLLTDKTGTGTRRKIYVGGVGVRLDPTPASGGTVEILAANISTDTTTGMKLGTATGQKIGFWNATPIVQPTTAVAAATVAATGVGDVVAASTTFDGYTIPQIVKAMRNAGLLA